MTAATLDLTHLADAIAERISVPQEKAVLNASEAAALLGVTRNTYTRYCREVPGFPARRLGGRWHCNRAALLRWLEGQN
ncbi:helix-turn-helix domain-containing protein [Deinococcus lacus]|uniref:Helix-turn-helix domain-containing protein n=1 Tax=Deinococcus lacus TaxID=392561 RepID=A0ABW1YBX9_9DEIO